MPFLIFKNYERDLGFYIPKYNLKNLSVDDVIKKRHRRENKRLNHFPVLTSKKGKNNYYRRHQNQRR